MVNASAYSSNEVMLNQTNSVAAGQVVKLTNFDPTNGDYVHALQDVMLYKML